jgi:hypothetical protein
MVENYKHHFLFVTVHLLVPLSETRQSVIYINEKICYFLAEDRSQPNLGKGGDHIGPAASP